MTQQQERTLIAGLKALAETTRHASAGPSVERAVLIEMRAGARPRPTARSHAWVPLAAALVIASGTGVWVAHSSTAWSTARSAPIRPAGFVAIPGTAALPPVESGAIVRVALPVGELPSYGIAIVPELIDGSVEAELFVAQDGHARAIRLVDDVHSSRSTP